MMFQIAKKLILSALLGYGVSVWGAPNLALHAPYTMTPEANYSLCLTGDKTDLTDGKFTVVGKQNMWEQPGAVGWSAGVFAPSGMVVITLDLGSVRPLERIVFSTVSGSGVSLPSVIYADVSTDGRTFYDWGCLSSLSKNPYPPVDAGYLHFRFDADFRAVKARYVRLRCIPQGYYLMMDEVEVYQARNPQSAVAADTLPPAFASEKLKAELPRILVESCVRRSYENVLTHIRKNWKQGFPQPEFAALLNAAGTWKLNQEAERFQGIYPVDELHRKIFALNGRYWHEVLGVKQPVLWSQSVYAPLSPLDCPPRPSAPAEISAAMMNGETRSAVLNITNPEPEPIEVTIALNGVPGTLFEVLYLDSNDIKVTSTALRKIANSFSVPSGMTAQIFIRFEPRNLAAGRHDGSLDIVYGKQQAKIPVQLQIAPIAFPAQAQLRTWLYDYLDFPPEAATHHGLKKAAIPFMRELELDHFVNTNVGYSGLGRVNIPAEQVLDAQNRLDKMDFAPFQKWLQENSGFRYHAVLLGITPQTKFANRLTVDDPQFEDAVAEWAQRWDAALEEMKADKKKIFFCVIDEPQTEADYRTLYAWSKALKKGAPELQLEVNPLYITPEQQKYLQYCDIVNPLFGRLQENHQQELDMVAKLLRQGKIVHTYSCGCGPFNVDAAYYRLQAWQAFRLGISGSGFWSLSDGLRGDNTSCNMYLVRGVYYSPLLFDGTEYLITKHLEALREGSEDYEYLAMLKAAILRARQNGTPASAVATAEKVLQEAIQSVCFGKVSAKESPCSLAEAARCKILNQLMELHRQ